MKATITCSMLIVFFAGTSAFGEQDLMGEAVGAGNSVRVRELLEQNPSLCKWKDKQGSSLFDYAREFMDVATVKLLVKSRGRLDLSRRESWRISRYANDVMDKELAKLLIANGVRPDVFLATVADDVEDVRKFTKGNRELANTREEYDQAGFTLLHIASISSSKGVAEFLIASGADIDVKDYAENRPLHYAAKRGDAEMVGLLLTKGADVNARSIRGGTALGECAAGGNKDVARLLIEHRADVNDGNPLSAAVVNRNADVVRCLIDSGAKIDARDGNGGTPLHCAAYWGPKEIVQLLLDHGADVNAVNGGGDTPLHLAAMHCNTEAAVLLLAAGADASAKNKYGQPPLTLAKRLSCTEMIELLLKSGGR
jgi:ankyrin repeat protein